jgi:hypothetical protein
MHPEIEKLIDLIIIDGQITEKERNVILNKAIDLGINKDEIEIILDGKLYQKTSNNKPLKEKLGNIKICPACGKDTGSYISTCICGHEYSGFDSSVSITGLLNKLNNIKKKDGESKVDYEKRIAAIINNTSIPNTKSDLLDFLTMCSSQADIEFVKMSSGFVPSAWANKGTEALLKAKILFREDLNSLNLLSDFEKKIKNAKRKIKLSWIWLVIFALLIYSIYYLIKK